MLQAIYEPFDEPKLARGSARCNADIGNRLYSSLGDRYVDRSLCLFGQLAQVVKPKQPVRYKLYIYNAISLRHYNPTGDRVFPLSIEPLDYAGTFSKVF